MRLPSHYSFRSKYTAKTTNQLNKIRLMEYVISYEYFMMNKLLMKQIMEIDLYKLQFVCKANVKKENGGITCKELFQVGSIWKNKKLLHNSVRVYACRDG